VTFVGGQVTAPVLTGNGALVHPDYHNGAIKIKVDGASPKFFLAIRDAGAQKYGVWCDGTNVKTGFMDAGTLTELSTIAMPVGDFWVEVHIPVLYTPGHYEPLRGYIRGFVWPVSGSKPGSHNLVGELKTSAPATPTVLAAAIKMYSYDGTPANIKQVDVGDGYNVTHPYRGQANFIGRWFNTITVDNMGMPLAEEIGTICHGSEIWATFSNTASLKLNYGNSQATYLSVSIDSAPEARTALLPATTATATDSPTNTVILATGLNPNVTHTVRVVVASTELGPDKWTSLTGFRFRGFTGDDGTFTVSPLAIPAGKRRILFWGDSITDGNGANGGGGSVENSVADVSYAKVAAKQLNAVAETHGFGSVGITKAGDAGVPQALTSNQNWFNTRAETYIKPDMLVMAYHSNDGNATDQEFIDGYKALIDFAISKWGNTLHIVLLEVSGIGKRLLLPGIANLYPNANFVGTLQEGITITAPVDTIHPDTAGHAAIGNHLADRLKTIFGAAYFGL
jgi:lysophospholipase L1-like esterase